MSAVVRPRVRALSIHAEYRCRGSGVCCTSGWDIPVEADVEERLCSAVAEGRLRHALRATPPASARCFRSVSGLPHGARRVLASDEKGRCVFLDPGRGHRCRVHGALGEDALPSACRQFPRVAVLGPLGVSLTLSHYCPTAAGLLFAGRSLRIVEDPPAFPPTWPYEGLDARDALPPLLRPGVLMTWAAHERWEEHAVTTLADEGRSPEDAVERLAATAEIARSWTPDRGDFERFLARVLDRASERGDGGAALRATIGGATSTSLGRTQADRRPSLLPAGHAGSWDLVAAAVPARHARPFWPQAVDDAGASRLVDLGWPALARPAGAWLAAKAFASWLALQGDGLRTSVLGVRVALGVLRAETARACAEAARPLDAALLREAIRRADLLLVQLADPEALARALSRCERDAARGVLGSNPSHA